ncbi:acyltransferase family protein [Sphingomonas sp. IC4-52]|uniref:acyltransferase family protein n=1 Tax=Sphingomonas sp. IC4-52 TaxID=2887202 RepID=UPI001D10823F|nr:acyltransferase [Sphingomonas sp. IC4-52]MCC2980802.1 acyltransferase [Sphingomonas sp. IC4-52]
MTAGAPDLPREDPSTPHRAWLPYLDGWRGISILAVLLGHFATITPINTGRLGVELFFCLSGRLMGGILFAERHPLPAFLWRRVSRVWPALWVFVFLIVGAAATEGSSIPAVHLAGSLTFTENYVSIVAGHIKVFDHLWSLAVEEWAYLVLAIVAFACRSRDISPVPILVVGALLCAANGILQTANGGDYWRVYWRTDVRLSSILLPCVAFLLLRDRRVWPWLPVVAGVTGLMLNINRVPDPIKYTLGTTLLSVSVATIDVSPAWVRAVLSWSWLRRIGLWSFSLYLWQQPFAEATFAPAPVRLAATVLIAVASFYLVENPTRSLLNRWWSRAPRATAPSSDVAV